MQLTMIEEALLDSFLRKHMYSLVNNHLLNLRAYAMSKFLIIFFTVKVGRLNKIKLAGNLRYVR